MEVVLEGADMLGHGLTILTRWMSLDQHQPASLLPFSQVRLRLFFPSFDKGTLIEGSVDFSGNFKRSENAKNSFPLYAEAALY